VLLDGGIAEAFDRISSRLREGPGVDVVVAGSLVDAKGVIRITVDALGAVAAGKLRGDCDEGDQP
jgi:hypothetical protein